MVDKSSAAITALQAVMSVGYQFLYRSKLIIG